MFLVILLFIIILLVFSPIFSVIYGYWSNLKGFKRLLMFIIFNSVIIGMIYYFLFGISPRNCIDDERAFCGSNPSWDSFFGFMFLGLIIDISLMYLGVFIKNLSSK